MRRALATTAAALASAMAGCGGGDERPRGVVGVVVERPGGVPERATGVVAADGRIVTVAHVLDGGGAVAVVGRGGGERPARVLRVDRAADLALLDSAGGGAAPPLAAGAVRVVSARGGEVRAMPVAVRRRVLARVRDSAGPRVYSREALELAADVAGGDSGAPVLGAGGELLGVVFARSRRDAGTAYAVEGEAVEALLRR